jgi:hypothetical protein
MKLNQVYWLFFINGCWCSTDYILSTLKIKREERMLFVPVLFRCRKKKQAREKQDRKKGGGNCVLS